MASRSAIVLLILAAAFATAALATTARAAFFGAFRMPLSYRSWKLELEDGSSEVKVSQFHLPVVASMRLGEPADLVISAGGASSKLEADEADTRSLDGPADITAQLFLHLAGDRLLLQGGANIPTGKKELDEEELLVAQALANPVLGFRLKEYGRGLDFSGGAAVALPLGEAAMLGLGAGFVVHGEYTLVADADDYRPGAETSLSAGLDFGTSSGREGGAFRLDGTYRLYGTDEVGSREVFEQGNQIELQALTQLGGETVGLDLLGRLVFKEDNTLLSGEGTTVERLSASPGQGAFVALTLDAALSETMRIGVEGEWNHFGESDQPNDNGNAFGIGPVLGLALGEASLIRLRAQVLTGNLEGLTPESDVNLSGFAVTASLSARAPR